jgi:hypothetical protein
MKQLFPYILLAGILIGPARAQERPVVEITLHGRTQPEERARVQLHRILHRYDLTPWIYTSHVQIQEGVRAHSHPILTDNPNFLDDDTRQLSIFVHEQFHWYLVGEGEATEHAIEDLRRLYPEVPVGGDQGGRSEYSTYLHLLVGWLEWRAMVQLVGDEAARENYAGYRNYRWIYRTVLDDEAAIGEVMNRQGLARAVEPARVDS